MESKEICTIPDHTDDVSNGAAYDLFKDPALMSAKANLPPEQREKYERAGKMMYNYNFEKAGVERDFDAMINKAYEELKWTICQGLHPSLLNKDEANVMKEVLGTDWYERFGYTENDLSEIATTPAELPIFMKS